MLHVPYLEPITVDVPDPREELLARALDTVASLSGAGAVERASLALDDARERIGSLPRTRGSRELAARAKLERARLGWLAAGPDPTRKLGPALAIALEAHHELGAIAPPMTRADAAAAVAGIACDLGEADALESARIALEDTIASLLREGATLEAASLLDDQAAIELRMGRFDRVSVLLDRALSILAEKVEDAPDDPSAALHLADVRRFLGRLPLHGAIAGATRMESLDAAVAHCEVAEEVYARLGRPRELARTVETIARLQLLRERPADSESAFLRALRIAAAAGDAVGLARITEGLAELFLAIGAPENAARALVASIELNQRKGSAYGLAADEQLHAKVKAAAGG